MRRPETGLLGGMLALPTSDWSETPDDAPPVVADWREAGAVEHVFTHFSLTLTVMAARGGGDFDWRSVEEAQTVLPTVFKKALRRTMVF